MTPEQEASLTGFGDCFEHYHSLDRQPTHYTLEQLQQVVIVKERTAPYTATAQDDIILVPLGGTIILPKALNGGEFEVIMSGVLNVTVQLSPPDLVYGQSSVIMTVKGMALHFKAITGGWIII